MKFHNNSAEIFLPTKPKSNKLLRETTHLAIAAHPDDLEMMASSSILKCMHESDQGFTGVVVTDGRNSPRGGKYGDYSDEEIRQVRRKEQKKAAVVGEYKALIMLDYRSGELKNLQSRDVIDDLQTILLRCRPEVVFTHNLADKHDTHVAVALRTIQAIRGLQEEERPEQLFGCEIWRDLDWLLDQDKQIFDTSSHQNLQLALIGVFDSQIEGGKRYDLAGISRRQAHGTFYESHNLTKMGSLAFGIDLTPLIKNENLDISSYICGYIERFENDVKDRISRLNIVFED